MAVGPVMESYAMCVSYLKICYNLSPSVILELILHYFWRHRNHRSLVNAKNCQLNPPCSTLPGLRQAKRLPLRNWPQGRQQSPISEMCLQGNPLARSLALRLLDPAIADHFIHRLTTIYKGFQQIIKKNTIFIRL